MAGKHIGIDRTTSYEGTMTKEQSLLQQENEIEEVIEEEIMTEEEKIEKENKSFSNKIVTVCVIMNILFTVAIFAIKVFNYAIVIPDSLIVAWFGFWGAELVALASIKKDKIKNKYEC